MPQFTIKQNDTRPGIQATLTTDLTSATVEFRMTTLDEVIVLQEPAQIVNAGAGQVRYDWVAADTEVAGIFRGQWHCVFADGKIETYPNSEYPAHPPLWIEITSEYG